MDMDRALVENAFGIMGSFLLERKAMGEICLFGGSALLFLVDWRKSTKDVDVKITSEHGLVIAARDHASARLDLPRSWLNENVTRYASVLATDADTFEIGVYPSYERPALRVMVADGRYVFAMKVIAAVERTTFDDRDFTDVTALGIDIGITTTEEAKDAVARLFPAYAWTVAGKSRLADIVAAASAPGAA